jgi:phosphatidylserine/phosphatidylglycerophosphate/cardiolipin synthase-like enzyme
MAVAFYQLFIIGTIVLASLGVGGLRRWPGRPDLTASRAAVLAGVGWSLFTLTHVIIPPLMAVQMLTIWGTVGLLRHVQGRKEEIARLRQELTQLGSEAPDRFHGSDQRGAVRLLRRREHKDLLQRALREARRSVVILSGWVNDRIVDRRLKKILTEALERGVDVYIGYGWARAVERTDSEKRALASLASLARDGKHSGRGQLFLAEWPNHAKILICDEAYAICGSYNWLSNRGLWRDERSWMVVDPEFVRLERDEIVRVIRACAG